MLAQRQFVPCSCRKPFPRRIPCSKAKSCSRHRFDQRDWAGHGPRPCQGRRQRRHQRLFLATRTRSEQERARHRKGFRRQAGRSIAALTCEQGRPRSPPWWRTRKSSWGSVDILVNNAGIQFVSPVVEWISRVEKWDQLIAINLSSAFHATPRGRRRAMKREEMGLVSSTPPRRMRWSHRRSSRPMSRPSDGIAAETTKTVALETAEHSASPPTPSAPAMSGRRWWKNRFPKPFGWRMRGLTREQVIKRRA